MEGSVQGKVDGMLNTIRYNLAAEYYPRIAAIVAS